MTSLKGARADLAASIVTAVSALPSSVAVFAFEPPTLGGNAVTVSTAGVTPDSWRLAVRIYCPAIQSAEGQDLCDDIVQAIDTSTVLRRVPRSDWTLSYDETKDVFFYETVAEFPREDF